MSTSPNVYGMKEPAAGRLPPLPRTAPIPPDRSTAYIVLSIAEIALAGVFAAIPLFWSVQYRRAVRSDPWTTMQGAARTALAVVAGAGAAVNVAATMLWLLAQA